MRYTNKDHFLSLEREKYFKNPSKFCSTAFFSFSVFFSRQNEWITDKYPWFWGGFCRRPDTEHIGIAYIFHRIAHNFVRDCFCRPRTRRRLLLRQLRHLLLFFFTNGLWSNSEATSPPVGHWFASRWKRKTQSSESERHPSAHTMNYKIVLSWKIPLLYQREKSVGSVVILKFWLISRTALFDRQFYSQWMCGNLKRKRKLSVLVFRNHFSSRSFWSAYQLVIVFWEDQAFSQPPPLQNISYTTFIIFLDISHSRIIILFPIYPFNTN